MTVYSIKDLVNPLLPEQAMEALAGILDGAGVDQTTWAEGTVTLTELEAFSAMVSYCTYLQSGTASSGFLDFATGRWLEVGAEQTFGQTRDPKQAGTCTMQLTNTSGATLNFIANDLVFRNRNTNAQYRNTGVVSLANSATATFPIQALIAGTDSNAAVGEIDSLVTSIPGLAGANTSALVGVDDETDDELIEKSRLSLGPLSPFGPKDAYRYAATRATRPDGTLVGVKKVKVVPDGYNNITVIVAGNQSGIPADANNLDRVEAALRSNALPQGITLFTESAVPHVIGGAFTIYIYTTANLSEQEVKDLATAGLTDKFDRTPIGGDEGQMRLEALQSAVIASHPDIFKCVFATPSTHVTVAENEICVLGSFTITVVQVAPEDTL